MTVSADSHIRTVSLSAVEIFWIGTLLHTVIANPRVVILTTQTA
jgi:hypothetical protein